MTIRSLRSSSSIRSVTNAVAVTNPTFVPGAPTIGTATSTGSSSATVTFTAPVSNGGSTIISYTAVSSPGNISATLFQSGSGTITVNGLSVSTSYTFTVYATNAIGNSANSSASNSITTSAATEPNLGMTATGGIIYTAKTDTASYKIHAFTTSGTFTISALGSTYNDLEILVVGGGSGGCGTDGRNGGPGGQAKWYGSSAASSFTPQGAAFTITATGSYTVTVGAGGAGQNGLNTTNRGGNTSFVGSSINVSSLGGTFGGGYPSSNYYYGGNGSGPWSYTPSGTINRGGADMTLNNGTAAAGGPGTGSFGASVGGNASNDFGGAAGGGVYVRFGVDALPFGFGGGGGAGKPPGDYRFNNSTWRVPGGSSSGGSSGSNGVANSGGGGGGVFLVNTLRNGGSGIVIVRYRTL